MSARDEREKAGPAATAAEGFRTRPGDHRFFATMAVLATAVIVTGFTHTYAPKLITGAPPVPAIVHLHAAVFACWLALFVTQTFLAARGKLRLHRRLGNAGMFLALAMLVLGAATAVAVTRAGERGIPGVEFAEPRGFLLLNLVAIGVFAALAGAAWALRRAPQAHKRLMLMALLGGLTPPGVSRLPFVAGHTPAIAGLALAPLLAGPVYDLATRRRLHPAYIAGVLLSLLSIPPVVQALSDTAAWRAIAAWLIG